MVFYSVFICFFFLLIFTLRPWALCGPYAIFLCVDFGFYLLFVVSTQEEICSYCIFFSDDCYVGFFDLNSEFEEAKWRVKNE